MNIFAKTAALAVTGLALTLGAVQAGPIVFVDYTPIDVTPPPDYTPIDVPQDFTPVDVPDNGPILNDDLNDALLDDDKADGEDDKVSDAAMLLACAIVGGDLVLTNKGDEIPPGTKVKWRAGGAKGSVALPNGLRSGQKAKIEDVVALESGKCTAEVIL